MSAQATFLPVRETWAQRLGSGRPLFHLFHVQGARAFAACGRSVDTATVHLAPGLPPTFDLACKRCRAWTEARIRRALRYGEKVPS